jgi:hypothetical protein
MACLENLKCYGEKQENCNHGARGSSSSHGALSRAQHVAVPHRHQELVVRDLFSFFKLEMEMLSFVVLCQ